MGISTSSQPCELRSLAAVGTLMVIPVCAVTKARSFSPLYAHRIPAAMHPSCARQKIARCLGVIVAM